MKVSKITNVSGEWVTVVCDTGIEITLPPNQCCENVDVVNLGALQDKVMYVANLTEVGQTEKSKTVLYD